MAQIKSTNNANTLEVTKLLFGYIKIVADFGREGRTTTVISAKRVQEYLSLKQGDSSDSGGKLRKISKESDGRTYLFFFVPKKRADLVVVKTSDLVAALK